MDRTRKALLHGQGLAERVREFLYRGTMKLVDRWRWLFIPRCMRKNLLVRWLTLQSFSSFWREVYRDCIEVGIVAKDVLEGEPANKMVNTTEIEQVGFKCSLMSNFHLKF